MDLKGIIIVMVTLWYLPKSTSSLVPLIPDPILSQVPFLRIAKNLKIKANTSSLCHKKHGFSKLPHFAFMVIKIPIAMMFKQTIFNYYLMESIPSSRSPIMTYVEKGYKGVGNSNSSLSEFPYTAMEAKNKMQTQQTTRSQDFLTTQTGECSLFVLHKLAGKQNIDYS